MKYAIMFGLLAVTLLSIIAIFNARNLMKSRVKMEYENKATYMMKFIFTVVLLVSLVGIYYLR